MAVADGKPAFLIKKIGGVLLLLLGVLLVGIGFSRNGSPALVAIGVVFLVGGAGLLMVKIARRNEERQL